MPVVKYLTGDAITAEVSRQMDEAARSPFNRGYSLGLQYPWVYGSNGGVVSVWCRYCGRESAWFKDDIHGKFAAGDKCHELNGLSPWATGDVLAAMDAEA